MATQPIRVIGVAWYDREDYRRILEIMEDADTLPSTYDRWRYSVDKLVRKIERDGGIIIRAKIDPERFLAWCAERSLRVDAKARSTFASEAAYEAARQMH